MEWITDPVGNITERYILAAGACQATVWDSGRHDHAAKVSVNGMTTVQYGFTTLEAAQAWCLTERAELRAAGKC
jgi:hypothetical protein